MMPEEQKKEKMLALIDKLTERTRTDKISWTRKEDGYGTPFKDGDIIEFSYNYEDDEEDEENLKPINFLLFFVNSENIKYEIFYVLTPDDPGYSNFLSLYHVVKEKEKRDFLKKYNDYITDSE